MRLHRPTFALTLLAAATIAGSAAFTRPDVPDDGGLALSASLAERKLYIHDGAGTLAFDVAVGKDAKPTPTGTFTIRKIVWNPAWVPPDEKWARGRAPQPPGAAKNPMKVVKIFFQEPDYYIHGTDDVESLGAAASHGCLRMHPDDAYRVARYLMEHGGQPRDESWFARVWHFRSETKTVYLDNPVPLTIGD
jgi:murein L,D-transpeptidase YcbB/YkuD